MPPDPPTSLYLHCPNAPPPRKMLATRLMSLRFRTKLSSLLRQTIHFVAELWVYVALVKVRA